MSSSGICRHVEPLVTDDDLPTIGEIEIHVPTGINPVEVFGIYGPPAAKASMFQNLFIGPRLIKANFQDRPIRVQSVGNGGTFRALFTIELQSCWDMITMISEAQGCSVFYVPQQWRGGRVPYCSIVWTAELFSTIFEWKR